MVQALLPVKSGLSAVGELRVGLLQSPPEVVQQVSPGGTAAVDQLQVDAGIAGQRRAVPARRAVASGTSIILVLIS